MQNGVKPLTPDKRDLSFHATFGVVSTFPDSFNTDNGISMPDQNADGLPMGCTGYTQSELCSDEDKIIYDPKYTYEHTLMIEGKEGTQDGCDLRDSLKSTIVYGVQEKDKGDSYTHRRGAYYNVDKAPDYFDGARSAMVKYSNLFGKKCSISVASRWCLNFSSSGSDGIVQMPTDEQYSIYSLHNHKICGWETIQGVPYLVDKSWQGKGVGDNGLLYFSREVYNKILSDYFAGAFVLAPYTGDSMTIRLTTLEVIISMLAKAGFSSERMGKIAMLIQKSLFGHL